MMPLFGLCSMPCFFVLFGYINLTLVDDTSSGYYFSGWYEDSRLPPNLPDFPDAQPDSPDVPRNHRKRHITEDDITFSEDLVTYQVTVPAGPEEGNSGSLQDGNGGVGWSDFDDLAPESISNLCQAQCKALCADSLEASDPCSYNCEPFKTTSWLASCDRIECIANCKFLSNNSRDDPVIHRRPTPPMLTLTQVSPKKVNLTWHTSQVGDGTIVFVVEELDFSSEFNWTKVEMTTETFLTVPVEDVCQADVTFRVAAVNSFGTAGYFNGSYASRKDFPAPGLVTVMKHSNPTYIPERKFFQLYFTWAPPTGWDLHEVEFDVSPQISKNCTKQMVPPVPVVRQTKRDDGFLELDVKIAESGYSCIYYTQIVPYSRCQVRGVPTPLTFDVSDCANIIGMECTTEPKKPEDVDSIEVMAVPNSLNFTLTWQPPQDMGDYDSIVMYSLTWGQSSKILVVPKEGFLNVSGSETSATISLAQKGEYHVWVKPRVLDKNNVLQPASLEVFRGHADFIFDVDDFFEVTTGENRGTTGSDIPGSYTTGRDLKEEEDYTGDTSPNPVVYVVAAILATAVLALVSLVSFRLWRNSKSDKSGWGGPSSLLAYDALSVKKQAKSCLVDNPFYDRSRSCEEGIPEHKADCWEVPIDCLILGEILGQGAFGQVVSGKLKLSGLPWHNWAAVTARNCSPDKAEEVDVAVKLLLDYATESHCADFMKEIDLMKSIGAHPNVVSMLGACTLSKPLYLVVEHMPNGDLLHYLRKHRHLMQEAEDRCAPEDRLTMLVLLSFARQIAVGMEFLSQKGFVHRDLAARNVLVGDNKTLKIGDFGLTRYIYDNKVYVTKKGGKLPLKWMAIESIFDLTFTTYSDVWSFGVVLFELITLGGTPYPTIANRDLLRELQSGHRMEMPDNCPPELYGMMRYCWDSTPLKRPSFSELRVQLEGMIEDMSAAKYLSIEVDENRDYYITEDESDSDGDIPRARAVSMPEIASTPSWTPITSSSTDENISGQSYSTNSTSISGGGQPQLSVAETPISKPVPIPSKSRPSTDSKATGGRRKEDLFRVSTCSSDELLPRSGSTSDGGLVLDCCSLESVGETKL